MQAELLLRWAGVRATRVRLQILGALIRLGYPISQPDLARLPQLKACDRVTLYRTLNLLRNSGLAHNVQGIDGTWRFCAHEPDAAGCPGDHPHFLCRRCGRMICLTGQRLPHVDVPPNVQVRGKQLVAYGLCGACAAAVNA
jgi:Fur family ferric uptake transcriptional regulator/Fur family zinc uptake transcriptional regulator